MNKTKILTGIALLSFLIINAQVTNIFPNDGNAGIGTTSPSELLHLESNGSTRLRLHTESTTSNSGISFTGKRDSGINSNHYIGTLGANNYDMDINVDENLFIRTNNSTRMVISSNGNIGLGTSNPTSQLEIRSFNNNGLKFNNNNTPSLSLLPNNGDSHFHISHTLDNRLTISQGLNVGDNKLFTIVNNGNIGIGTTIPDAKLTVKGDIHAEEVKVDLSVPGPDYVFKEDYNLKSLEEVQNYIKTNGHLPNIPSAKEMEENGIQLGEMNMKLLEKIEELTLYVISQKKELLNQKKIILELNSRIQN